MKQSASETWKRTSSEMKTNLSTFVGAGVCEERCCLLFADSGVLDGAMSANVADLVALVASSSVDNGCTGVSVVDVDRGRPGGLDAGVAGGLYERLLILGRVLEG